MIAQLDKNYLKTRPTKIIVRLISYLFIEGRPLTGPGRFINPLTFLVLKFFSVLFKGKNDSIAPIFILGTGRSGTTILGKILSIHRDIAYLNEPKAIWHEVFGNEDIIGNFTENQGSYRLSEDEATKASVRRMHSIYRSISRFTLCKRVVDKYPELIFKYDLVKKVFPKASFILITRNGLDTAGSIASWSKRNATKHSSGKDDWWGRNDRKWQYLVDQILPSDPLLSKHKEVIREFKDNKSRGAVEWVVTMNEYFKLSERNAEILMVKYEDLIEKPETVIEAISENCNLPTDEKVMEYVKLQLSNKLKHYDYELDDFLSAAVDEVMRKLGYTN